MQGFEAMVFYADIHAGAAREMRGIEKSIVGLRSYLKRMKKKEIKRIWIIQ